jgi:hypothetical protein
MTLESFSCILSTHARQLWLQTGTAYKVLSESASLLTEVPGALPGRHALQLEANVVAAAFAALGHAEAAVNLGSAQDGPDAQQQQYMLLAAALPRVGPVLIGTSC